MQSRLVYSLYVSLMQYMTSMMAQVYLFYMYWKLSHITNSSSVLDNRKIKRLIYERDLKIKFKKNVRCYVLLAQTQWRTLAQHIRSNLDRGLRMILVFRSAIGRQDGLVFDRRCQPMACRQMHQSQCLRQIRIGRNQRGLPCHKPSQTKIDVDSCLDTIGQAFESA